jgi:hypothetical protein
MDVTAKFYVHESIIVWYVTINSGFPLRELPDISDE